MTESLASRAGLAHAPGAAVLGGMLATAFGLAILVWPAKVALAMTVLVAAYALLAGAVYVILAVASASSGTGTRIAYAVLGVFYVVAGVAAFTELKESAAFLAVFVTLAVGILWVVEGVVAFVSLGETGSKMLTIVFAVFSIVAGIVLILSPAWGAGVLWWTLGVSLVVLGALNAGRGIAARRRGHHTESPRITASEPPSM
ncbi:hypothetical protein E1I21_06960 [Microbacterium oleivorans]|uniref:HdeD family acid-resistance protein n=1 Tax=Microbacterium oleivorans TaxID=273677 RepID=UPI0010A2BF0C|nr:DUF308 domain-containing protein [Microbacterium oleivorans]THE07516.1 hypothetical protein E1I21_06960 [Microbacterium oleivorans]